jgi:hypothetical protein
LKPGFDNDSIFKFSVLVLDTNDTIVKIKLDLSACGSANRSRRAGKHAQAGLVYTSKEILTNVVNDNEYNRRWAQIAFPQISTDAVARERSDQSNLLIYKELRLFVSLRSTDASHNATARNDSS